MSHDKMATTVMVQYEECSLRGISPCLHPPLGTHSDNGCWVSHPKLREHWRVFLAVFGLLILGTILLAMGIVVCVMPEIGVQSYVFLIAGAICFIPGAYHVVYMYFAVRGRKGYDFYQLPMFT